MAEKTIILPLIIPRYQTKAAQSGDWKTKSMPEKSVKIKLNKKYTKEEMDKIRWGYIPEQMEDKWFVYWEKDKLFFHRSWTGVCIYIVIFEKDKEGNYFAKEAIANRNPQQYKIKDDEYDKQMIYSLIDVLLLNKVGKFPTLHQNPIASSLEMWSIIGREILKDKD